MLYLLWCCHISPDKANGRRTDRKNAKLFIRRWKCGEGRRGSHKERLLTGQVTDRERSTNVRVTDV